MPERSTKGRYVLWVFRLIALSVVVVLTYRFYRADGYLGLIGMLFAAGASMWMYSYRQGEKLAIENMKKYGLEPDRDEATTSRKPIDN